MFGSEQVGAVYLKSLNRKALKVRLGLVRVGWAGLGCRVMEFKLFKGKSLGQI